MLKFDISSQHPLRSSILSLQDKCLEMFSDKNFTLKAYDRIEIVFDDPKVSPFFIDWTSGKWAWRLKHSGKHSEAVARAVIGKHKDPVVVDATAGVGRDSLVLQSAGAVVSMFERNPLVWLLLADAKERALENSEFVDNFEHGLPNLMPYGTYIDYVKEHKDFLPDVVYFDPMFPPREKNAQVKKEMQVFHSIVGKDEDSFAYAQELMHHAKRRVVIKRPARAEPLFPCSYSVDGKACHFDCYAVLAN